MEIPKSLKDEIWDYCRINSISNIDEFTLKLVKQGFTVEKYGATPTTNVVEKIVEKIVEVPVEKIVEKRVEVPVAMVDTKVSDELKKYIALYEESQVAFKKAIEETKLVNEQLLIEKNKKKNDLYGE